jgi:hypothetical protein
MNDMPFMERIKPRTKALLVLTVLILIGILAGYIISYLSLEVLLDKVDNLTIKIDQIRIDRSVNYYIGAVIILTIELVLLIGVLFVYFDSYRKIKSRFLIVLNVFIVALLVKSILSIVSLHTIAADYINVIPYISRTFLTPGFSILSFILTGFEIAAISILVYLSMD